MTDRKLLLERHQRRMEESVEEAPLDYIQLRNMEALRQWQIKWAFASKQPTNTSWGASQVGA